MPTHIRSNSDPQDAAHAPSEILYMMMSEILDDAYTGNDEDRDAWLRKWAGTLTSDEDDEPITADMVDDWLHDKVAIPDRIFDRINSLLDVQIEDARYFKNEIKAMRRILKKPHIEVDLDRGREETRPRPKPVK